VNDRNFSGTIACVWVIQTRSLLEIEVNCKCRDKGAWLCSLRQLHSW
jgi:hypothetical protein